MADIPLSDALREHRARQHAFAESRQRVYLERPQTLGELELFLPPSTDTLLPPADTPSTLVVTGPSGSGKSALLAHWSRLAAERSPRVAVITFFIGAAGLRLSYLELIRYVLEELGQRFGITDEIPTAPRDLENALGLWLRRCENQPLLLIIDALDQLDEESQRLVWLPGTLPSRVRMIVSARESNALEVLNRRRLATLQIMPLTYGERFQLAQRYLGQRHEVIGQETVERLAKESRNGNPLFHRIRVQELQFAASPEEAARIVESFLASSTLEELYGHVFERIEREGEPGLVADMLKLLATSRQGLDRHDLGVLAATESVRIDTVLTALRNHLIDQGDHRMLYHEAMRRAITERYLPDESDRRNVHLRIGNYLSGGVSDRIEAGSETMVRKWREAAYHLRQGHGWGTLQQLLCSIPVFVALYRGGTAESEVLACWKSLIDAGGDPEDAYQTALAAYRRGAPSATGEMEACETLGTLFDVLGLWNAEMAAYRRMLELAEEADDRARRAEANRGLGMVLSNRGEHDKAMECLQQALSLATEIGDRRIIAGIVGSIGSIHARRGEYEQALQCFRQQEAIGRELGDQRGVSLAVGNMGTVYNDRNEHDRALDCFRQQEAICRELGDRRGLSVAIGNLGIVFHDRCEYDQALECFRQQEAICHELGNRLGLCNAIGNMGIVYSKRGEYDQAMECYRTKEAICRELGNRRGLSLVIGTMGSIYCSRGEYDQALECFQQKEAICRELGDRRGLSVAIGNMGRVYSDRGEYDKSLECSRRQEAIGHELGDRHILSLAIGNMGSIYSDRAEYDKALECFRQQEAISRELGDRHVLSWAIGGIGSVYFNRGEYDQALEAYRQKEAICRELGDRHGLSLAIGATGLVYSDRGEYDQALECLGRAIQEHRALGFLSGLTSWLDRKSRLLLDLLEGCEQMPSYLQHYIAGITEETWRPSSLRMAAECVEESIEISRQLKKSDTLFLGYVCLARIDAATGHTHAALQRLGAMLDEAIDDDQRAEIHYWLWALFPSPSPEDGRGELHRTEALRLYERLAEKSAKQLYRTRSRELTGIR